MVNKVGADEGKQTSPVGFTKTGLGRKASDGGGGGPEPFSYVFFLCFLSLSLSFVQQYLRTGIPQHKTDIIKKEKERTKKKNTEL
jgi:hypothetical protein